MMDDQELAIEVLELALAVEQGTASEEERARLECLLADSEQARRLYLCVVDDTATLAETASTREPEGEPAVPGDPATDPALPERTGGIFHRLLEWIGTPPSLMELAIAACLLVVIAIGAARQPASGIATSAPLATVVSLSGVQWEPGAKEYREWSELAAGDELRFTSGMLELSIDHSVQLVLEGPADIELVSRKKAIARLGKLVARVGPEGVGFEIETPHAQVTDRGTSFGITITPHEQTDVVVYEGHVDLEYRAPRHQRSARRLTVGEGVRVDADGALDRIMLVEDSHFVPPPRLGSVMVKRPTIITSVRDNVSLAETAKYYRIVGGGIQEDCRAYVDRLHQWNGIDGRGIPPALRTADYVMGFNGDKILPNLEVSVELRQAAHLFVLWDNRVEVPDWLRMGFSDTMWEIGLDETFLPTDGRGDHQAGSGPGHSVDLVFSVWQRDVPRPGHVELGPVRSEATSLEPLEVPASMYGIAAIAWNEEATRDEVNE